MQAIFLVMTKAFCLVTTAWEDPYILKGLSEEPASARASSPALHPLDLVSLSALKQGVCSSQESNEWGGGGSGRNRAGQGNHPLLLHLTREEFELCCLPKMEDISFAYFCPCRNLQQLLQHEIFVY